MGSSEINLGIIIQARMGSSRLPGKVLKKIGNRSLLEHIFSRLTFLRHPAKVILATTIQKRDDIIESFGKASSIEVFRGSEENVLERYYLCAKKYHLKHIVRLTADNPFTDIDELDRLITLHLETDAAYSHSFGVLPVGAGAEIFTFDALENSYYTGTKAHHIEHVNEYIQENPDLFRIAVLSVPPEKNRPDIRLTVDTEEDYQKACRIIKQSGKEYISTEEAIKLCLQYA
jgi:spore coat polysaccharide biosynthesis protein SpsF